MVDFKKLLESRRLGKAPVGSVASVDEASSKEAQSILDRIDPSELEFDTVQCGKDRSLIRSVKRLILFGQAPTEKQIAWLRDILQRQQSR